MTDMNRDDARQVCQTELGKVTCAFGDAAAAGIKKDRVVLFNKAVLFMDYARNAIRQHLDSDPRLGLLMAEIQMVQEIAKWNVTHDQTYKANADEGYGMAKVLLSMVRSIRTAWVAEGATDRTAMMQVERVM